MVYISLFPSKTKMNEEPADQIYINNESRELKSLPERTRSYLRFTNCSSRTVDIVWVNFHGLFVKYCCIEPGQYVDIDTYKNHPWIAFDYNTKERLHLNRNYVYFPVTAREYFGSRFPDVVLPDGFETRLLVRITIPIHSLRFMSLMYLKNIVSREEDVNSLQLPHPLSVDLKKVIRERNRQALMDFLTIQTDE